MAPLSQDSGRQNLVTPGTALCRGQRHQGSQEWPPSQMLTCSSGLALKGGVQEGPRHTGHDWLPQVQPSPEQDSWNRTATLPNATDHFLQAPLCTLLQDSHPLASLPLLGYSLTIPSESENIHKDYVFKLHFKSHVYYFRAESEYTFER